MCVCVTLQKTGDLLRLYPTITQQQLGSSRMPKGFSELMKWMEAVVRNLPGAAGTVLVLN